MELLLVLLVIWLAFGVGGAVILRNKGRSATAGVILGAMFGVLGLIIALLIRPPVQDLEEQPEADEPTTTDEPEE